MKNKMILLDGNKTLFDKLTKVVCAEIAKAEVETTNEELRLNFNLQGTAVVRKGESYEQVSHFAVPYAELLQLALSKLNGVTVDSILKEYMNTDLDSSDFKKKASATLTKIKGTKKMTFKGKVTAKGVLTQNAVVEICEFC